MSSPYTIPTGDGYEGTYTVRSRGTQMNLVTVGLECGTPVSLVAVSPSMVGIRAHGELRPGDGAILEEKVVDPEGNMTIVVDIRDHLGVAVDSDLRLYDRSDHGLVIVPGHPDDPFVDGEAN